MLEALTNKPIDDDVNNCIVNAIKPEFPKSFEETKWIVMSSCLLLIPAIYAFAKKLYLYGVISLFAAFLSINHWRDAEDGIRRAIDCYIAYTCFVVFVVLGLIYCRGIFFYVAVAFISMIIALFLISDYLSIQCHPHWHFVHILFHLFVTIGKCIVIYCII